MKSEDEIYKEWPFKIRYLSRCCWDVVKALIIEHKVTSALEFGSGVSTILLDNMGLEVVSYETDLTYMNKVKGFNLPKVDFRIWNNVDADITGHYGLSLVDGILPRTNQLYYAMKHSRYVIIDDFTDEESSKGMNELLKDYTRLDDKSQRLAIFRNLT